MQPPLVDKCNLYDTPTLYCVQVFCIKYPGKFHNKDKKKEEQLVMKSDFIKCGAAGWCLEILWTGLHALGNREWKMMGQSSLWMFPIYGMAACIGPLSRHLKKIPIIFRGGIYMTGIFAAEFGTGMFLKHYDMCPWDYSLSLIHI